MMLTAQQSTEQIERPERLRRLLLQVNIDRVLAPDAVKHYFIPMVSRRGDAFALYDTHRTHKTINASDRDSEQSSIQREV